MLPAMQRSLVTHAALILALSGALLASPAPARGQESARRLAAEEMWSVPLPSPPRAGGLAFALPAPAESDGGAAFAVVFALEDRVEARRADDGTLLWDMGQLGAAHLALLPAEDASPATLAIADDRTPAAGDGRLLVVDPATGAVTLEVSLGGDPAGAPRALAEAVGFAVPLEDGSVLEIELAGARRRLAPTPPVVPPLLRLDGQLAAFTADEPPRVLPLFGARVPTGRWDALAAATATGEGMWIYAGTGGAEIIAARCRISGNLRLRCRERWEQALAGRVTAPPSIAGEWLFVPSWDSFVYAFDAENGHLRWRSPTGARVAKPLLVWDDALVAVAEGGSTFTFLEQSTGAIAGRIEGKRLEIATVAPTRAGDVLVATLLTPPATAPVLRAWRVRFEEGGPPQGLVVTGARP